MNNENWDKLAEILEDHRSRIASIEQWMKYMQTGEQLKIPEVQICEDIKTFYPQKRDKPDLSDTACYCYGIVVAVLLLVLLLTAWHVW